MNSWVSRLLGRSAKKAENPAASAKKETHSPAVVQEQTAVAWHPLINIDALFLGRLLGANLSAAHSLSAAERNILESLNRLSNSNLAGADLVPRVPSVLPQLLQSMHNENISGAELAQGIARDVSLVAEVIRQANSSYYQPRQPIASLENAVMVLGKNGLRMLIAKASFRPVIHAQSGRFAKSAAPLLWDQSEKCAQACSILAKEERIDAFASFLAGLMQNVGMIVAFRLIDQVHEQVTLSLSENFCREFYSIARQLTYRIAMQWDLPPAVLDALAQLHVPESATSVIGKVVLIADQLSKLRMLSDQGVLEESEDSLTANMPQAIEQCFEEIKASAER
ncbi:MAG: HDOD domain-containing protein [Burkholderiales bacterium]|nr:HDOD domain-containing protein [Burkholderiales bacterium]